MKGQEVDGHERRSLTVVRLGNLRARRWDLASAGSPSERNDHGEIEDALPSRTPDAELRYSYSAGGNRVRPITCSMQALKVCSLAVG